MQKKDAAKILYDQDVPQEEIASILGVTPKTITTWKQKYDWEKTKAANNLQRETSEEKVWKLINHNLHVLELIASKQSKEIREDSTIEELQKLLTPRGDSDAIQKLFTTVKGKELEWTHIVKLIREFLEYVESEDTDLAKSILPISNRYLNERRS